MGGDYSRDSFDALRDNAALLLQQGRPATDADWNEMVRTLVRRQRSETVDTIGRAVVPRETENGFQIRIAGAGIEIGRGRYYLAGMQLECHGSANFGGSEITLSDPVLDRSRNDGTGPEGILNELISPASGDFLDYMQQPYWPTPTPAPPDGQALAYVVAWEREVTALHAPEILEPALGGIDSSTRLQTVWQVRLAENISSTATCSTPDTDLGITGWEDEIAPSSARLDTDTIAIDDPENPCLVPPSDGYTGLESQLYRVELHTVGNNQTNAFFKYSRENASVAAAIETIAVTADRITVDRIGRDEILRFNEGDWVEVTDDHREFNHRSGQLLRVAVVNEETRQIELESTIDADLIPSGAPGDTLSSRHSRLIRWDQSGTVRLEDGTEWVNLDAAASSGLIPVPPAGTRVILESGIVVNFSTAAGDGRYREMDYWLFAARTAGTQIERLRNAPPDGIHRHISRLAILSIPNTVVDCRVFWPPEFEGDGCACTVCVSADGHNSGALTIQQAIDQVDQNGGTVCLDGGVYELLTPIIIQNRQAITLKGQGLRTLIQYRGSGSAIRAIRAIDVQFERFSLLVFPPTNQDDNVLSISAGIHLIHCANAAIRRVSCLAIGSTDRPSLGIAIAGLALGIKIEECLVLAPVAIGSLFDPSLDPSPRSIGMAEVKLLDNILFGNRAAIRFSGFILNIGSFLVSRNLIFGVRSGIILSWFEPPTGSTSIDDCTIIALEDAAVFSVGNLRLQDNEISGGPQDGNGVRLLTSIIPTIETEAQIIGNRIGDLGGSGIRIEALMSSLLIKRNVIRHCGLAAISHSGKARVKHISIDNNVLENIAENSTEGVAIALSQVLEARIAGNTIRGVGGGQTPTGIFAGIVLRGVRMVSIDGNTVSEIHPGATTSPVSGVSIRHPYRSISIQNNQISGSDQNTNAGQSWTGIEIGENNLPGDTGAGGNLAVTMNFPVIASEQELLFVEFTGLIYALSLDRLISIGRSLEPQITVNANHVQHSANSIRPLIAISDQQQGSCIFTNNQCRLNASGNVQSIVNIIAQRVIASNNVVRRQSDSDAMTIVIGETGRAAVVGNLTFGNIRVTPPGNLQPPFVELNLIAE